MRAWYARGVAFAKQDAGMLALINLLLATVAFGKDLLQAAFFGTSAAADALTLAFFIPDTLGNNLMAFAIGVACVPMFCKLLVQGETGRLRRVFLQLCVYAVLLSSLSCLLVFVLRDPVLQLLGSGMDADVFALTRSLLNLLLPTMVLFPLCMIASGALQAQGNFKVPALGPVLFNTGFLLALVLLLIVKPEQEQGAWWTAIGIAAGVVGMTALLARAFFQSGGREWFSSAVWRGLWREQDDLLRVVRTFAPFLLILFCSQFVYMVERHVASLLGSGTIAGLNYAFRLAQFPNWVFVAALTTVLLPAMARAVGERNPAQVRVALTRAIKITLLLTVPMSLVLYLGRVPIVALLLQHGSFDHESLRTTADILAGYSLSIVPQALAAVGLRYYMAVERMRVPAVLGLLAMLVTIGCDLLGAPKFGPAALGYGAAVGAWVNALAILLLLNGDLQKQGRMGAPHESISHHHSGV
ncbi:murein biosynthesis integral membrane protein MurJ [Tumebacillus permanentifrigoris]|nr:lipid II flippase MurJ [Tumebacillus permanentifrigoris]